MAESDRDEIAKLEMLYSANPEGRIFTHLADAYRRAGELERARELVEDGLQRHGDYSSAHVVLARVLAAQGDEAAAEAAYRRVLGLDPENRVALRALADIALGAGRSAEAANFLSELLVLNPADEEARELLGSIQERGEDLQVEPGSVAHLAGESDQVEEMPEYDDESEDPRRTVSPEPFVIEPLDLEPALEPLDLDSTLEPLDLDSTLEPLDLDSTLEPLDLDLLDFEPSLDPLDPGGFSASADEEEMEESEPEGSEVEEWPSGVGDEEPGDEEVPMVEGFLAVGEEEMSEEPDTYGEEVGEAALPAEGAGGFGHGLMMTETMGDVYAGQGLIAQAVEVYRELLRSRPDDARLRAKLAELAESERQGPPDRTESSVADPGVTTGPSIGTYLEALLAFGGVAAPATEPATAPAVESSVDSGVAPTAEYEAGPGVTPGAEPGADPVAEQEAEPVAEAAAGALGAGVLQLVEEMVVPEGATDLLFLEESMVVDEAAERAVAEVDEGAEAVLTETAEEDDLEVFRAWLRNLKG